ncbi:hypothetical protein [Alicyclobacillus kakegawensis]|uniref:hypothetical protein n=1 Tax=Alicyclobacillus kakegawensis TaxID=392012 RepID=UPI0012EDAB1C|nr:hypothetical protein [Alicyclobacillus kakegawensis]
MGRQVESFLIGLLIEKMDAEHAREAAHAVLWGRTILRSRSKAPPPSGAHMVCVSLFGVGTRLLLWNPLKLSLAGAMQLLHEIGL